MGFRLLPPNVLLSYFEVMASVIVELNLAMTFIQKKGCLRSVVVRTKEKDVPALHLKTNCRTIGCTINDLYAWADKNC